jgi:hypothetical protein
LAAGDPKVTCPKAAILAQGAATLMQLLKLNQIKRSKNSRGAIKLCLAWFWYLWVCSLHEIFVNLKINSLFESVWWVLEQFHFAAAHQSPFGPLFYVPSSLSNLHK